MIDDKGVITLNIREFMDYGLTVFDVSSKKVGTVFSYETALGYMSVRPHPLSERLLHIPFSAITHIDPRELFISHTREEAYRLYDDPPPRSTLVEERTDPITGEDISRAITMEPSGYDGTPIPVEDVNFGKLMHHIAPGFDVYSSEAEHVGTVKRVDRTEQRILVKSGPFSKETLVVPFAFTDFVDREERLIYLSVSNADLRHHPLVEIVLPESEFPTRT